MLLPNLSRLCAPTGNGANAKAGRVDAGSDAKSAVFSLPDLVERILGTMDDPKEACNLAQTLCDRAVSHGLVDACNAAGFWRTLTENVFGSYVTVPEVVRAYLLRAPNGVDEKQWFKILCKRRAFLIPREKELEKQETLVREMKSADYWVESYIAASLGSERSVRRCC